MTYIPNPASGSGSGSGSSSGTAGTMALVIVEEVTDAMPLAMPGPAGAPGGVGATGPAGATGQAIFLVGDAGEDGERGFPGPQGPVGAAGSAGSTGAQGPAGPAIFLLGENGEDGERGPMGPQGPQGVAGSAGSTGAAGANGPAVYLDAEPGDEGPMGPPGPAGAAGAAGSAGATGAAGPMGPAIFLEAEPGEEGWPGAPGNPGVNGTNGSNGSNGATGAQGPMGPVMLPDVDPFDAEPMITPPLAGGARYLRFPNTPATSDQSITAATLTKITGSELAPNGFYAGQVFRWVIVGSGSAAGTAANTITVRCGTNNSTADGTVASFTTAVGTAAASQFVMMITLTVRTLGASATATAHCNIWNSAATGFVNIGTSVLAGSMSTFNSTTASQFLHVCLQTGASKAATIKQAAGEVVGPNNPQALFFP